MALSPRTGGRTAFLPEDFVVPTLVAGQGFRIRPITVHDAMRDYFAVMDSLPALRERFHADWGWPQADLTAEQALVDAAWLQKEAQLRRQFAYVVTTPDEERQLGRIHVLPAEPDAADGAQAVLLFWVRSGGDHPGLAKELADFVRHWVDAAWPFEAVRVLDPDGGPAELVASSPLEAF
ncbi:GNAT family N-acetyltransferase [Actinomadura logoneensis]|uniref:GNAT family N-acetyltransferase n=1 Tax=Actinomadura logoneensis TaxID=2293572 RepID=UPI0018F184B4|nr:GNAT family N-acetyltransferase [Actinomadura logoneensis]